MAPRSNTSGRPRWGRRIALTVGFLGIGYLGVLVLASRFLDPEALAALLEPRLEEVLGREVEIAGADVGFLPLSVRIRDLAVSDPTGMAPELARIESVAFGVALLPLLQRRVEVHQILIQGPEAHLLVTEDGRSNFGDLSRKSASADPASGGRSPGPFAMDLRSIRLSGGRLIFRNEADSTFVELLGLDAQASVLHEIQGPWHFVGRSDGTGRLRRGPERRGSQDLEIPSRLSFDIQASPDFEEVEIRSGDLGTGPVVLSLSGTVKGLKGPIRTLSLSLRGEGIPLDRVFEALPGTLRDSLPLRGEGEVGVDLSVTGELGPEVRPQVSGTLSLARGDLQATDGARVARYLDLELFLLPEGAVTFSGEGELLEGPFTAEGRFGLGGGGELEVRVDAYPELSLARSLITLPEGTEIQGRIKADLRVAGRARDPGSLRFWGEASPNDIVLTAGILARPLTVHGGTFDLQGNSTSFRDLSFSLGEDRFTARGSLANLSGIVVPGQVAHLQGTLQGARLDLTTLSTREPPDSLLSYGKAAFARMGGRTVEGRTPEEVARELRLSRPDSLPLAGELTLALDTLIDAKGRMEDLRANLAFGPRFLAVSDASFRRYGGVLRTSANLRLGDTPEQPFSLSLSVESLTAPAFLGATSPLGRAFRGELSLRLEMVGTLDSLLLPHVPSVVGSGSFSLRDGGINSILLTESLANFLGMDEFRAPAFRDWSTSFVLADGRVQLAEASIPGAPGEPRLGGGIGLGGELDLLSIFSLPSDRLSRFARSNLGVAGEVAGRVANRPDFVQAVVRIGGSVLSPELGVDPGAAAATIGNAVREEARMEAQRQIRTQAASLQNRASSFLRGILSGGEGGGRGAQPRDTVQLDRLRPDSVTPDSLHPDSIGTDTVPPDTSRSGPPSG